MKTYRADDATIRAHSGRQCHLTTPEGRTFRGVFVHCIELALTNPGHYRVVMRQGRWKTRTPAIPGDTEIHIYPKEA